MFDYLSPLRKEKDFIRESFLLDTLIPKRNYTEDTGVGAGINESPIRKINSTKNRNYFV